MVLSYNYVSSPALWGQITYSSTNGAKLLHSAGWGNTLTVTRVDAGHYQVSGFTFTSANNLMVITNLKTPYDKGGVPCIVRASANQTIINFYTRTLAIENGALKYTNADCITSTNNAIVPIDFVVFDKDREEQVKPILGDVL
jgi:hypothetical protein